MPAPGGPVPDLDLDRIYPLAGPVLVEGARPGDVVELEPLEYAPGDWGWTASYPGLGLLPDDFAERGRGLAIAINVLDELAYRRADGKNHWRLVRNRSD